MDNDTKKYYTNANKAYEKFTPDFIESFDFTSFIDENTESIIKFLTNYQDQFGYFNSGDRILETGCGFAGIAAFYAKRGYECSGVDLSPIAISLANKIHNSKYKQVDLFCADLCEKKPDQKYQHIIDSHLLHCLAHKDHRQAYLKYVYESLEDDGQFYLETMCYHNKIQTPIEYSFGQDNIVYKGEIPYRKLIESKDLELELKEIGFKIKYLYFHNELSFNIFSDYIDYPFEFLPKTIRLVATR